MLKESRKSAALSPLSVAVAVTVAGGGCGCRPTNRMAAARQRCETRSGAPET